MKVLYDYFCQFIDNMIVTKDLIRNKKLMCEEYQKSQKKLKELKQGRIVAMNNICNRLNSIFGIKLKWYRKGFKLKRFGIFDDYVITFPPLHRNTKEFRCLEYMWENLQKKYRNSDDGFNGMVDLKFDTDELKIGNILARYGYED